MSTHSPNPIAVFVGILATNVASWWSTINWDTIWSRALTIASLGWVLVQTAKFCIRWFAEHRAKQAAADKVCQVRREIGACPLGRSHCPSDGEKCEERRS